MLKNIKKLYGDVFAVDDIVYRQRYPRYNVQQSLRRTRKSKRKRGSGERLNLVQKFVIQTVVCVVVLLTAVLIKNINSPITNYCKDKIKRILSYNIDINSVFGKIDSFLASAGNNKSVIKEDESVEDVVENVNEKSGSQKDALESENPAEEEGTYVKSAETVLTDNETENQEDLPNSFIIPVGGIIGALYGERVYTPEGTEEIHQGIDIKALKGTPVKAAAEGEVIEAGENQIYGKYIKIKHGEDIISLYAHCSDLLVSKGQNVKKGETVAKVGNTGTSQEPHLHFEVWEKGTPVNPLDYIQSPSN